MLSIYLINLVLKSSKSYYEIFLNFFERIVFICHQSSTLYFKNFIFILFVIAVILLLSLVIILWNYKLRSELKKHLNKISNHEAFVKRIFENSCTAIVVMDAKSLKFIDCNSSAIKIYGLLKKDEVLKCTPLEVSAKFQYDGTDSKSKAMYYLEKAKELKSIVFEWKHQRPNGEFWDAEVNLLYFSIDDEFFYQFSLYDITQKKKTEFELKQSEERFELAMQAINEGLWDWDVEHNKVFFDERYYSIAGYTKNDFPQEFSEWEKRIHPDDIQHCRNALKEHFKNENFKFDIEFRFLRKDGSWMWIRGRGKTVKFDKNGKILRMIGTHTDITAHKLIENALIQSENLAKTVIDNSPIGISVRSATGQLLLYNKAWIDIWEISEERLQKDLLPRKELVFNERDQYFSEHHKEIQRVYTQGGVYFIPEFKTKGIFSKSGKPRYLSQHFTGITNSDNIVERVVILTNDITDYKEAQLEKDKLQTQLNQSQKLESIGRLAGGVAHDFNNMLGVIIGYTELALMGIEDNHPIIAHLNEINNAAKRSANLTRQLLGFARKQTIKPIIIEINDAINNMKTILSRLIHENIILNFYPCIEPIFIKIDPSQLDQILANLCINARDAISNTGIINIEVNKTTDNSDNNFAMISVQDNGCGMSQDVLDHIFEPFFTTKEIGSGTGLGLANVYGIVKQNNGYLEVESELDKGTTFKVFLPSFDLSAQLIDDKNQNTLLVGKSVILLVEDEETLLKMTTEMLQMYGYIVHAAKNTAQAIELASKWSDKLDLLITDVIMPEMNGMELSIKIKQNCPNIGIIYMSGYTANVIEKHGILNKNLNFLQKPFNIDTLISLVQKVISESAN